MKKRVGLGGGRAGAGERKEGFDISRDFQFSDLSFKILYRRKRLSQKK